MEKECRLCPVALGGEGEAGHLRNVHRSECFQCCVCSKLLLTFSEMSLHFLNEHKIEKNFHDLVLLPSSFRQFICNLCHGLAGLTIPEKLHLTEDSMRSHVSSHSKFFAKRWDKYSQATCRLCGEQVEDVDSHAAEKHPREAFAQPLQEPREQPLVENNNPQEMMKPTNPVLENYKLLDHSKKRHLKEEQNISNELDMTLGTDLPEYRSWCAQEELKNKVGQVDRKSWKQRSRSSSMRRKSRRKSLNMSPCQVSSHRRSRSKSAHRRSRSRSAHRRSRSRSAHRRSRSRSVHKKSRSRTMHRRSRSRSEHRRSRSRSAHKRRGRSRSSSTRSKKRSIHTKSRGRSQSKRSHSKQQKASESSNRGNCKKADYQSGADVSVEHVDSECIKIAKADNMKKKEAWEQLNTKSLKSSNQTNSEKVLKPKSMLKNFIQGDLFLEVASSRKHGPWCEGKCCFGEKCWYQDQVQDSGLQCVSRGTSSKPCKFFKPGKSCRFGDDCKNMHLVVKTPVSAKVCEPSTCEEKVSEYRTEDNDDTSMWTMGPNGKLQLLHAPVQAPPSIFEPGKVSPLNPGSAKTFSPIPSPVGENSLSILASCYAENAPSYPPSVSLPPVSMLKVNNQIKNASISAPKTEAMFACVSRGTKLRICHHFRKGYCNYGMTCYNMHIVPWVPGMYSGAPIISASASGIPDIIPKGFKCESIGSSLKQCSYFNHLGQCNNMDMCLDMHLVPSTDPVKFEVGSSENNNMQRQLNIKTEYKETQLSKSLERSTGPADTPTKAEINIKNKSKVQEDSCSQARNNIREKGKCQEEGKSLGENKSGVWGECLAENKISADSKILGRSKSSAERKNPAESMSPAESQSQGKRKSEVKSKSPANRKITAESKNPDEFKSSAESKNPDEFKSSAESKNPAKRKNPAETKCEFREVQREKERLGTEQGADREERGARDCALVSIPAKQKGKYDTGLGASDPFPSICSSPANLLPSAACIATSSYPPTKTPSADILPVPVPDPVPDPAPSLISRILKVSNLPTEATSDNLKSLFTQYGQIKAIKVVPDYYENKPACVMVEFGLEEEAIHAKEDLDGILLGAARIQVAYTKKQL